MTVSKMTARKAYAWCLTIAGLIFVYSRLIKMNRADVILGFMLAALFFVVYCLPLVIFGARIELNGHRAARAAICGRAACVLGRAVVPHLFSPSA
jgi:uncharacterized membrane protein YozB (DUF420 family)